MTARTLTMWTIYDHPLDFPHGFVAREWLVDRGRENPTGNVVTSNSLDTLRGMMAKSGLVCLAANPATMR